MSDFATVNDVVAAMVGAGNGGGGCRQDIYKASITTAAGFYYSGWLATGYPTLGSAPTTWAHPTQATAGCWVPNLVNAPGAATNRILYTDIIQANANLQLILVDRLGHMGGLSGTVTTAQSVSATLTTPAADGRCASDGSDVLWFLEWYIGTGTSSVTVTVAVTYSDNSTGNVSVVIPASVPQSRMYQIVPASGNLSIKGITSVTLPTTGTAGSFGVTAVKRLCAMATMTANAPNPKDWATLALPKIGANACICGMWWSITTTSGVHLGQIVIGDA